MKIFKRSLIIIMVILWNFLVKLPLTILIIFLATVYETLNLIMGVLMRQKLAIDTSWPNLTTSWNDVSIRLQNIFDSFLAK